MKKSIILILILSIVIGVPLAKKYFSNESVKEVQTEQVGLQTIKASILASGQLKHEDEVKLTAEVIGRVTQLFVKEGDKVSKGELVLTIDDQTYRAAEEQQQAAVDQQKVSIEKQKLIVENLHKQWQRKLTLFEKKLLDQDAFDLIHHQLDVAKVDLKAANEILKQNLARLEQAKDQLSKTKIHSPINGIITSLDIKEGETAISSTTNIAGSALMTIANPSSMLAEINVDEADISEISIDQKAEIIAIAFPNDPVNAVVESIASSAKQARGRQSLSFAIKLKLIDSSTIHLRPGMSCRAEVFTRGEKQLLAVPLKAIRVEEDNDKETVENFVFTIENGVAKKVKIKAGISDDAYQEVLSGIEPDIAIITGPDKVLRHLKDGDTVSTIGE
ncbi:efflux RND transporter periplasmic adaptor subunit [Aliikangiella maris]|uniref:Efflux RND transporter periplasmic adaptor subunit n=2 Tax=Aliikangiella maris TaxID=3162458 RepID=A0ABV3MMK7_9GAMM